jgi:hypothetical protein
MNYDEHFDAARDGHKFYFNVQPVIPMTLSAEWNLISRTILPFIDQKDVVPGTGKSGNGDVVQSLFFSPRIPTRERADLGSRAGLPAADRQRRSARRRKMGLGPTGGRSEAAGSVDSLGALASHIWSEAGNNNRQDISAAFLQPFAASPTAWTYTLNTESTYDWKNKRWSVPTRWCRR